MTARILCLLTALSISPALGQTVAPPAADTVVAQAGKQTLTAGRVRRLVEGLDAETRAQVSRDPAALARLVRTQMLQSILLDEARAKKFDQTPDVAARADAARDAVLASAYLASLTIIPADYPAEADITAAYEANKARLVLPRQYQVAQIFIAGTTDKPDDETARKLRDLKQSLAKPPLDFAAVARRVSEDRVSADRGGELGWLREDQIIPAVRDAVSGMQVGAVSDPVRAPDGWHVVKLLATRPSGPPPLTEVKDQLVRALREQRIAQAQRAALDDLQRRQPIALDEINLQRAVQP